ncbi:MAG: four helix bundle protein [Candidatus Doudnabacteria bacterium]|nr:four helix bundle protein [Candidatus Doudnabacteria bacterium]
MEHSAKSSYIILQNLEVYKLARELSKVGWIIYGKLDWQTKKINGDQFIESTDSVGANIAEGYGRFHFLDKIKFYYNARGSFLECYEHWIELMFERKMVVKDDYLSYKDIGQKLSLKLNHFIAANYKAKSQ